MVSSGTKSGLSASLVDDSSWTMCDSRKSSRYLIINAGYLADFWCFRNEESDRFDDTDSGSRPIILSWEIFDSMIKVGCRLSLAICLFRSKFFGCYSKWGTNIRKGFLEVTSSISARRKCFSYRRNDGSARMNSWRSFVTESQVFFSCFITFCSTTYMLVEILPLLAIYSCSYGNGGAFKSLFFAFRIILTVVPSSIV